MPPIPVRLATQSYESRSLPAAAQRLVNMYPEQLPDGANGPVVLLPTPGLKAWSTVGSGPIRGLRPMGANLYVVSGSELYAVDALKTTTLIGSVPGTSAVRMSDNGTHVSICTQTDAFAANASGISPLPESGFNGAEYQDGYGIFTKAGTQQFFITALDNMTAIDPLDFSTADVQPDNLIGCISDHRELWLFKERTIEIWVNTGNTDFPFQRSPAGFIERGCIASGSIANTEHRVLWLGDDLGVYASQGYNPQRISTPAIDDMIAAEVSPQTCEAFTYSQNGHTFYCLNFDTLSVCYDLSTGRWHERQTFGAERWKAQGLAEFGGLKLVGDYLTSAIYSLADDEYADNDDAQERVVTTEILDGGMSRMFMDELQLNCETGVGSDDGTDHENPTVSLEWSDDGGHTWSVPRVAALGPVGEYSTLPTFTRLGSFRRRVMRLRMRAPNRFVVMGATAKVSAGL